MVFVVGLSKKLADPETLKKQEYFGKFGKIHKVVINQSTSYAGSQGPSASAYVTYNRCDDALKAILAVNNVHVDGRTLKASLGTTKYCSHFLRGAQCQKQDCMYLHELGEEAASFTKEEMQMGKHQEYEQKLLEQYMNSQNIANSQINCSKSIPIQKKTSSPITVNTPSETPPTPTQTDSPQSITPPTNSTPPNTSNKEAWPCLQQGKTENGRPNPKPDTSKPNHRLLTDPQKTVLSMETVVVCFIEFWEVLLVCFEYQSHGDVKRVKTEQEVSEDWNRVYEESSDDESLHSA